MKKCNNCGTQVEDQLSICTSCGGSNFSALITNNKQAIQQLKDQTQNYPPIYTPTYHVQNVGTNGKTDKEYENIIAGVVGAFLFSLIGGLLYFVIYQIGIIAGICGLVIFVLSNIGYGLFAKPKNATSMAGLIVSIISTIVMILLAEYYCISFEIFNVYKGQGITIIDAIRATPEFLTEPEIVEAVAKDLAFAYIFGFIAIIGNIVNVVKTRKYQ